MCLLCIRQQNQVFRILNLKLFLVSSEEMFSLQVQCPLILLILSCHVLLITGTSRKICDCEPENLSHPGCGIIPTTSTILNGSPGSYPWMVFLYSLTLSENASFCGGTLISELQVDIPRERRHPTIHNTPSCALTLLIL